MSSLVPTRATVVLLAGLAGDVESENAYREQLQSWLEILQASGDTHKLFVLFDNPDSISIPRAPRAGGAREESAAARPAAPITNRQSSVTVHVVRLLFAGRLRRRAVRRA